MDKILINIEGVICYMDDILVHSKDENRHTSILLKVKERLQEAGLQLNEEKYKYHQRELKFLGHIILQHKVNPDPEKLDDIKKMSEPKDVLRRRCVAKKMHALSSIVEINDREITKDQGISTNNCKKTNVETKDQRL